MTTLVSKIHYKNFEPGEFVEGKERNFEETIRLIEEFPWNVQRDRVVIGLSNPSVTIEGKNGDFLKLSVFFNQKYVLRYINEDQRLFTKSVINLKDAYGYIKGFFEQPRFNTTDFKKETGWRKDNVKHFVTQEFRYELTPKSIRNYLLVTTGMNFFFTVIVMFVFLYSLFRSFNLIMVISFLVLVFVFGGGLNLILFFNYYKNVKGKILIMSKGNDIFYFGDYNSPLQYDKKDIVKYTTIRNKNSRNQFSGFAIVEITFSNGTLLKIPNLLIDHSFLENKLFEYPRVEVNKFPYLKEQL